MIETSSFIYQSILNGDHTHQVVGRDFKSDDLQEGQTIWQHLDISDPDALNWLNTKAGIEPLICDALCAEETRPRSLKSSNGLMVVLRGVNLNPGQDSEDMVSIRIWVEKNRVLSVRRRNLVAIHDIVDELEMRQGPCNPAEFLTVLIDKLADRIGDFVNDIDDALSHIEDTLADMNASDFHEKLGPLRRKIAVIRRYMSPQRDALDRLNFIESNILDNQHRQRLREESDRVSRYLEDLDLARERSVVLQEAFMTQMAQEQNNRMYALSIISAIFLPLGFLTGLLGINVGGMPGADNPQAFWVFVLGMIVMVGFQFWILKKLKWL